MNIKDIPVNEKTNYTKQVEEVMNGESVYQFQFNGTCCRLMHVGTTLNHADVLINSFNHKQFKCHMVSCLYNSKELSDLESTCIFPLFKLNMCIGENFHSCINYNFHTFKHIQDNVKIISCAKKSNNADYDLKGYYSVTYHKNGQIKYKKTYKTTGTHDDIMEILVESLVLILAEKIV